MKLIASDCLSFVFFKLSTACQTEIRLLFEIGEGKVVPSDNTIKEKFSLVVDEKYLKVLADFIEKKLYLLIELIEIKKEVTMKVNTRIDTR